jgi:hypothetical protein
MTPKKRKVEVQRYRNILVTTQQKNKTTNIETKKYKPKRNTDLGEKNNKKIPMGTLKAFKKERRKKEKTRGETKAKNTGTDISTTSPSNQLMT